MLMIMLMMMLVFIYHLPVWLLHLPVQVFHSDDDDDANDDACIHFSFTCLAVAFTCPGISRCRRWRVVAPTWLWHLRRQYVWHTSSVSCARLRPTSSAGLATPLLRRRGKQGFPAGRLAYQVSSWWFLHHRLLWFSLSWHTFHTSFSALIGPSGWLGHLTCKIVSDMTDNVLVDVKSYSINP